MTNLLRNFFYLLSFFAFTINAQTIPDSLAVRLQSVDVFASQYKLFSDLGRTIHVVDRKTIQQLPVQNIDELLESIPGVDIRNRGVGGTQSDISIRGGSFDQVLILLNGVNLTDPQTGHYNLNIPVVLSDVVRVEVLQGSSIYGSNAFSGAINIITESNNPTNVSAQLSAGSYSTYLQNITAGYTKNSFSTLASATHKSSQGYMQNTDYDILNVFSQTNLSTKSLGKFDLQLGYQTKAYGANSFYSFAYPNQFDYNKTLFGSINWNYSVNRLLLNAQTYYRQHYDRFELFRNMDAAPAWYTTHNYHLTDVSGAKFNSTLLTEIGKFSLGFDMRNEHISSNALGNILDQLLENKYDILHPFTKTDNRLLSTAALNYSKGFNSFYLSVGLSETYTEKYGLSTAGGLDLTYFINDNSHINFSANSAQRLPTFTDLYLQNSIQQADANLKPEKAKTFEITYNTKFKQFKVNISTFYRIGIDVIDWVKLPDSPKWQSKNLAEINAMGSDVLLQYDFKNSFINSIKLNYSYLNIDKKATNFDSKYALDYLKHKFVFTLQHRFFSKISTLWKIGYFDRAGNYADFASGSLLEYKPYTMLDTRIIWESKHVDLFMDINNILNASYADFGGLSQPGTNFTVGLRYKLK